MDLISYSAKQFAVETEDGTHKTIEANNAQQRILGEMIDLTFKSDDDHDVHAVYHSMPKIKEDENGYSYWLRVKEWAKGHPSVVETGCDDTMFMSSSLFLIPHRSKYKHMGTTVMFIPQCGDPVEFFLYPEHMNQLIPALQGVRDHLNEVSRTDDSSPEFQRKKELKKQLLESAEPQPKN